MFAAPAEILPLMRMIHGFFYYVNILGVGLYAKAHVLKYVNKYQKEMALIKPKMQVKSNQVISQFLVISVLENQEQKVKVHLPRKAIEQLDDFIDDDLKLKLESQNINVEKSNMIIKSTEKIFNNKFFI